MGKIISREEQTQTLKKLGSELVATRFMTVKYIYFTLLQEKIDYTRMDMEDPEYIKNLLCKLDHIAKEDSVDMVKKEANLCLENLKKKVNPAAMIDLPVCTSCGERVVISFRFCTKCGMDLKGQKWVGSQKLCEKCQTPIDPAWFNCSNCGNMLVKKVEASRSCPMCNKKVEPNWILCPFCGSKLKFV